MEFLLRLAFDLLFRILFSLPGWIAAHVFRLHGSVHAEGCFVFVCGLVFWTLLATGALSRQRN